MGEIISNSAHKTGEFLMRRADRLTKFRSETSPALGAILGGTDEMWETTILFGAEVLSDGLDGMDARAGAKLLGIETTDQGAIDDPAADKVLVNSTLLGLGSRYLRRQDYLGFGVLSLNYAVNKWWRDPRMAENREEALKIGYDPKAILSNKAKTAILLSGLGILVCPLAKQEQYKKIGLGLVSLGTITGIAGEKVFRRRVQNHKHALSAEMTAACPDKVTVSTI